MLGHDHVRPQRHIESVSDRSHGVDDPPARSVAGKQGQPAVTRIRQKVRVSRLVPGFPRLANRGFHVVMLPTPGAVVEDRACMAAHKGSRMCATAL